MADFRESVAFGSRWGGSKIGSVAESKIFLGPSFGKGKRPSGWSANWKNSLEEVEPEPDKALTRWAEWIKIRRGIFNSLAEKTQQIPACLGENVGKRLNQVLDKILIDEAQKYKEGDRWRGHPRWYDTVKNKKDCEKEQIVHLEYPSTFTYEDDPDIMRKHCYFGVPRVIAEEQGLGEYCERKEKPWKWDNNPYLARRKEELKDNIEILEDFRPDIDNLYVKGHGCPYEALEALSNDFTIPAITVTPASEPVVTERVIIAQNLSIEKPVLLIDNVPVGPTFPETDDHQWVIEFPLADLGEVQTRKITFRNIGTCAVRYEWRRENDYENHSFPIRDFRRRLPRFHFYQKRGTILPGQEMALDFTFSSLSNGFFREVWKLSTSPRVRHAHLLFILQGGSTEAEVKSELPWSSIESTIQQWVKDSCVQNILDEIERGIRVPSLHAPYADMFGENELFEFNNPKLHYRTREVTDMKEIYSKVSDKRWNFSALKLRNTILEAGLSCEDTIKYMDQLNHLVGELMHPPKEDKMERMKYKMVYTMLCAFFNQMGTVADRLLNKMSCARLPSVNTKYPPIYFDDPFERWMINHVRTEPTGTMSEKAYKKQQSKEARKSKSGSRKSSAGRKSAAGRKSSAGRKSGAGKRQSAAGGAKKRQSAAGGGKKRQSAAGGGKRQSAAGGGKRQSAAGGGKEQGAAGGKRKSAASGGSRKSMGAGKRKSTAGGGKKSNKKESAKPSKGGHYIWLTDPPVEESEKRSFPKEPDRDLYRSLLEAYTRDLLALTVDKICAAIDTINTVEAGKEFEKDVSPVAYREHYKRPDHIPQLPSLF